MCCRRIGRSNFAAIAIRVAGVPLAQRPLMHSRAFVPALVAIFAIGAGLVGLLAATQGGSLPGPLPLFPPVTGGISTSPALQSIRARRLYQFIKTAARGGCIRILAATFRPAARRVTAFPTRWSMARSREVRSVSYSDESDGVTTARPVFRSIRFRTRPSHRRTGSKAAIPATSICAAPAIATC